ncbi:MAG: CHAT domain-containing protein, partial [Stigonema ocellatum SAG 48.90 = DSM 106950]|nr:CHAT domain-containing protein [Stigonema ocellatum SAG 48.90 = DSM 106950]
YKFYIDLLMQLHKKHPSIGYNVKALNASEKSRARVLLELLTEARANIRKGASPQLLDQEKRLTALIDAKEKLRFEIVNSAKISDPISKAAASKLSKEISQYRDEYQQLQDEIKKSNPQYASLKYPSPLTLPQIQQQLDKDTLLLQYSLGKEHSYLWAVSSNSVDSYELPKQAQIEKAAINLFCLTSHSTSKPPTAPGRENPCKEIETRSVDVAAQELSQIILAPVKQKLGQKRLVIVADGALQYTPFAALASPSGEKAQDLGRRGAGEQRNNRGAINVEKNDAEPKSDSNYEPLLVKHEIINLPSASTIAILRQQVAQRKKAPKTLAILADPVFDPKDDRVTLKHESSQLAPNLELERSALARSANLLNRSGWNRLDGTRAEAESILKQVPSSSDRLQTFDFDANYTWATSSQLKQFRILHFATHGFVNDENPELSGIVLSLVNKQGKDIQGYLRLNELFNLDYPADLIVLSACETGLGKNIQGEGLVGLTRGLMYAGGERLVVSLWQVSDEGTSMLMQEFYKEMLLNGKSPNVALRAAQLKMWNQQQWRSPYYWAAFTFLGEWR